MIGRLFMGGADGFAPGIGAVGVDVFVLGEGQGLGYNGEKQVPCCSRDDTARWRPSQSTVLGAIGGHESLQKED